MSLTSYIKGKNIKTALHIGAYTGEELSNYASWGFKKVIWVEANPQMYIELCDNLTKTDYGIENITFNELISDKDDEPTDFHLYYWQDNRGMSSIFKMVSGSAGQITAQECEKRFYNKTIKLNSITIDTLFERNNLDFDIDFINVDTQGAELLVFSGATKLLENVKCINSEATFFSHDYENGVYFNDLYDYLKKFGFVHIGNPSVSGDTSWGDSFFEKGV